MYYPRACAKAISVKKLFMVLAVASLWSGPSLASPYTYSTASTGVVVMDVETKEIVARVPGGDSPFALVLNASGTKLYVTDLGSSEVRVSDTTTNTVIVRKTILDSLQGIAVDEASNRLYVGAAKPYGIHVLDATTLTSLNFVPGAAIDDKAPVILAERLKLTADGKSLFIAHNDSQIYVLDTTTFAVSAVLNAPGFQLKDVVLSADEQTVYVAAFGKLKRVTAFSRAGVEGLSSPSFSAVPEDLVLSPSGDRLYVALGASTVRSESNRVVVLNSTTLQVINTIQLGQFQWAKALAISADGKKLYVANAVSQDIAIIDTEAMQVESTTHAQAQVRDITIGPDTYSVPSLSLTKLDYPQQAVGTMSDIQTVRLINTGKKDLNFSSITPAGGDFSVAHDCGTVLLGKAFCFLNVTFKPTTAGPRTGSVDISYIGAQGVQSLALEGTGGDGSASPAPSDPQPSSSGKGGGGALSAFALFSLLALTGLFRRIRN